MIIYEIFLKNMIFKTYLVDNCVHKICCDFFSIFRTLIFRKKHGRICSNYTYQYKQTTVF